MIVPQVKKYTLFRAVSSTFAAILTFFLYMKTGTNYPLKTTLFWHFKYTFIKSFYTFKNNNKLLFLLPAPKFNRKSYTCIYKVNKARNGKISRISHSCESQIYIPFFLNREYIIIKKNPRSYFQNAPFFRGIGNDHAYTLVCKSDATLHFFIIIQCKIMHCLQQLVHNAPN